MHVTEHHHRPQETVDHKEDLTEVKTHPLIPDMVTIIVSSSSHNLHLLPDVVKDKVRKGCCVRNLLVGQGETRGGREEA